MCKFNIPTAFFRLAVRTEGKPFLEQRRWRNASNAHRRKSAPFLPEQPEIIKNGKSAAEI